MAGEKDRISNIIDEISGYGADDFTLEDTAKLIEAGGKAYLLHRIWQTKGKLPHEILALNKRRTGFFCLQVNW